jgi:uncharacterized protein involved in exopolysaccharide biosynthesis
VNTGSEQLEEEPLIDLYGVLTKLAAKRWWIVSSVVIFTAAFAIAAFVMIPVYRAVTVLIPAGTERGSSALGSTLGQLGGIAALAGINVGSTDTDTEEALAVLRSRQFTESFINDEKLMPKLFAAKWDGISGRWKTTKSAPTPARAYRHFHRKIRSIGQDKKTGLITVQIEWTDPSEAAAWANELVRRLNEEMRLRAVSRADAYVRYLEKELESTTTVETRAAIGRLIEAQVKQRMLALVSKEYAFRVVDKAMAPDRDDPARPNKLLMFIAGPLTGLVVGAMIVLLYDWRRSGQARATGTHTVQTAPSL